MDSNGLSAGDLALLQNGNVNEGSWIWFLLIFVLLGWGGAGGRGATPSNGVTESQLTSGFNNQAVQAQMNNLALATQQNNYETAQLINNQTTAMMSQNNTNLINAIQGFNQVTTSIMGQTNALSSKIDQIGYQMENCCCSIKTQMLNDRLADRDRELSVAQNALNNANQTQTILSNLGRFVAWEGSGTAASSAIAS